MKYFSFGMLFLVMAFIVPALAQDNEDYQGVSPGEFHQAQTGAEIALDTLLQSDKNNEGGILHKPAGDEPPTTPSPFTDHFLKNLKAKGKEMKRHPEGKEKYYDLVSNILTCGTPYNKNYNQVFYSIQDDDTEALITSVRSDNLGGGKLVKGSLYKMLKNENGWQLNSVICEDKKFNITK
jgi:hypothetical protein